MGNERSNAVAPRLLVLHRALRRTTQPDQFIPLASWRTIVKACMRCDTRERVHDHTETLADWGLIRYEPGQGVYALHVEPNPALLALVDR